MMDNARTSAINALWQGALTSLAHWRVLLLWWLAGLVPAFWLSRQVANAAHAILAHHPEAGRIIAEPDLAALADAWLANNEVIAQLTLNMLPPLLLTALLAPWTAGIAVTGLRAATPPGFATLCRGGLREYAPQLRLYLLALLPLLITLPVSMMALSFAEMKAVQAITYSQAAPWHYGAWAFSAVLVLPVLASISTARAAFATDPMLRSALLALGRGWRLMGQRFFAWLAVLLVTLLAGLAASLLLARLGLAHGAPPLPTLLASQITVLTIGWSRLARLAALQRLLPKPGDRR